MPSNSYKRSNRSSNSMISIALRSHNERKNHDVHQGQTMPPNSYQSSSRFHLTLLTLCVVGAVYLTLKYDSRASPDQYHRNTMVEQSSLVKELNYGSDHAQERKPVIHTFYASTFNPTNMTRAYLEETLGRKPMLRTWTEAWSQAGWETVVLTFADAQKHPYFNEFYSLLRSKGISNQRRLEYLHFLAMSSAGGGWFADLSVLPLYPIQNNEEFSSLPNNGEFTSHNGYIPSLFSGRKGAWDNIFHKFIREMNQSELSTMQKIAPFYKSRLDVLNSGDAFIFRDTPQLCERTKNKRAVSFHNVDVKENRYNGIDYASSMYLWIRTWRNKCLNEPFTFDSGMEWKYDQTTSHQNIPYFLIIGAQKAATTFINYLLQHHPMIGAHKIKEKHFFDNPWNDPLDDKLRAKYLTVPTQEFEKLLTREGYTKMFPEADGFHLTFDSTPETMIWTNVLPKIQEICPRVKIVVMLRNPIDRLFSQYNMYTKMEWFKGSFEDFIVDDLKLLDEVGLLPNQEARINTDFTTAWKNFVEKIPYPSDMTAGRGLYSLQLSEWFKYFPRDSFLVLNYHDLAKENGAQHMYNKVLSFLGLPPHNLGSVASSAIFQGGYKGTQPISDEAKSTLNRLYHPYNQQLSTLLGDEWKGFGETS